MRCGLQESQRKQDHWLAAAGRRCSARRASRLVLPAVVADTGLQLDRHSDARGNDGGEAVLSVDEVLDAIAVVVQDHAAGLLPVARCHLGGVRRDLGFIERRLAAGFPGEQFAGLIGADADNLDLHRGSPGEGVGAEVADADDALVVVLPDDQPVVGAVADRDAPQSSGE
jgi:hypothetical protein